MADKQPNIVVFLWDDCGWGELGCYGGGVLRGAPTPRIDNPVEGGAVLEAPKGSHPWRSDRRSLADVKIAARSPGRARPGESVFEEVP